VLANQLGGHQSLEVLDALDGRPVNLEQQVLAAKCPRAPRGESGTTSATSTAELRP
jgi:hypothetical protein